MKPLDEEQRAAHHRWVEDQIDNGVENRVNAIVLAMIEAAPGFECPGCGWPWPRDDD